MGKGPKKRLFLALFGLGLAITVVIAYSLGNLLFRGGGAISRWVVLLTEVGLWLAIPVLALGLLGLVLGLISNKPWPLVRQGGRVMADLLFPVVLALGRLLRIPQDWIQASFIEVNNYLVRLSGRRFAADRVMILLPHCLQNHTCPRKITTDIRNCRRCGLCVVGDVQNLAAEYGAAVAVATGGTAARRRLEEIRPRAVVAVACERDLASGIQDTGSISVIGVPNLRPHGPCFDTTVDLERVRQALEMLTHSEANPVQPS